MSSPASRPECPIFGFCLLMDLPAALLLVSNVYLTLWDFGGLETGLDSCSPLTHLLRLLCGVWHHPPLLTAC